ncbi:dual specificity protein phosphatase family protein [Fusobacterium ulcerans]|uniref:dual specificity protein phosphatase family protein n=1 Tax=Fusobacterium ulcerans TaxID=861 RepID=UPI001D09A2FE|nr:dual specificity protein phosphatase family protein [Fusobacterium ulcerans]MCB8563625.1 dual specificity protein phosphatase family protein [Fusobacterium ulcerans]MCB8647892.1 dual specificity protein phosphatase family protein [Fusobacterium ulcerans]
MNTKILKIKKMLPIIMIFFSFFILTNCSAQPINKTPDSKKWAIPIKVQGADNFYKVSETLFRSEQPTEDGMKNIEAFGIGTVISLRSRQKDVELAKNTELNLIHVSMRAWNPKYEDAVKVMYFLNPNNPETNKKPILIHCYHGADRTGMMVALYRMVYQNWEREEALDEMLNGGYGYHSMWKDIVAFIKTVDIEQLRKDSQIVN